MCSASPSLTALSLVDIEVRTYLELLGRPVYIYIRSHVLLSIFLAISRDRNDHDAARD